MNLHIVALPHTEVSPDFCGCAFTSKVLKFCKMMGKNYRIRVYAPEGPDIPGAELVPVIPRAGRLKVFGADDPHRLPIWPIQEHWDMFSDRVIEAMKYKLGAREDSMILLTGGWSSKMVAEHFKSYIVCEPGVGYEGIYTNKCAFESYGWMHYVYAKKGINDGRFYDCVIPNYFDTDDFPHRNQGNGKYLLFLGRLVARKGPHIASQIAERCGLPLLVAGPGGKQCGRDIVAPEITIRNAEYVGPVDSANRSKLLAGAKALLVPTTYIEPFGGVAIEAMLSGTPVVSTDWGAFPETVKGVGGFRFHTLAEGAQAVERCGTLNPMETWAYALHNYSLGAVKPRFDEWFSRLRGLLTCGWYN